MEEGTIVRLEELTRMGSDVQDTLITILSEKTMPIPELNEAIEAKRGFNVIATANNRDKGVNDLSSALKRRFNVVVLPSPATLEEETGIVVKRVLEIGSSLELPPIRPADEELVRVVTLFRELRDGKTLNGKTKLKSPTGSLSTAEAISVGVSAWASAAHFGDGTMTAESLAPNVVGAVVKDPCRTRSHAGISRKRGADSRGLVGPLLGDSRGPLVNDACSSRRSCAHSRDTSSWSGICRPLRRALEVLDPACVLVEGPPEGDELIQYIADPDLKPPVAMLLHASDEAGLASFMPFAEFSPEWQAIQWALKHERLVRFIDWPAAISLALQKAAREDKESIPPQPRTDALDLLASAAGYEDGETFWNGLIEQHGASGQEAVSVFASIETAMTEARAEEGLSPQSLDETLRNNQREAFMRTNIRAALKAVEGNIAVVTGAWHVSGLRQSHKACR